MSIISYGRSQWRKVAPWWDKFDSIFAGILGLFLLFGYFTFVESITHSGVRAAWPRFVRNSGLLALLTTWTAIIALYRLRHRPDKTRPAIREDFKSHGDKGSTDFGLRNFGPGPALYVQAKATVEKQESNEVATRFKVHDQPIHLREGEFASLVRDVDDDWLSEMADKYAIDHSEPDNEAGLENPPRIHLYFSYVSKSGAREPTRISTERDDDDLLTELKIPDADARQIELRRVVNACRTPP